MVISTPQGGPGRPPASLATDATGAALVGPEFGATAAEPVPPARASGVVESPPARAFGAVESPSARAFGPARLIPAGDGVPELLGPAFLPDFLPDLTDQSTSAVGAMGRGWKLVVKRFMDIMGSLLLLALFSPVLLLASLAVVATSRGSVLFVQERLGRDGRPFRMLKFRSMYRDAEARRAELADLNECTGPVFKVRNDPRITPVGRVLRKLSLDELPQLFNVLRGDMSLVGPRPPLPEEYALYGPHERQRLAVKPGLTCTWQVSGRSDLSFDTWMEMDLAYIRDWSLGLDLKLLLLTIPAVVSGRGAY